MSALFGKPPGRWPLLLVLLNSARVAAWHPGCSPVGLCVVLGKVFCSAGRLLLTGSGGSGRWSEPIPFRDAGSRADGGE